MANIPFWSLVTNIIGMNGGWVSCRLILPKRLATDYLYPLTQPVGEIISDFPLWCCRCFVGIGSHGAYHQVGISCNRQRPAFITVFPFNKLVFDPGFTASQIYRHTHPCRHQVELIYLYPAEMRSVTSDVLSRPKTFGYRHSSRPHHQNYESLKLRIL